ncbi:MAG: fumarylacetoacetate hydrolase family protein [Bifidobacteriaceae bacterium]|jgi:acylpyruvate hydrolase|nr:fumarylacetoacetate hydrolase family protein [Bifidobacteriaceae bacterium]
MRLATLRPGGDRQSTRAARIEGDHAILLEQFSDVGALLAADGLEAAKSADGPRIELADASFAPVVPRPGKILCVGMNYGQHIKEMGRTRTSHPTLFAKLKETLIGSGEAIQLPPESSQVDWEGELAVVIGRRMRRADLLEAEAGVAGYTLMCDTSMRDWQYRTSQWCQGKNWERSTPFGPWLATPDELPEGAEVITRVNSTRVQRGRISDLMLSPALLVLYASTMITLEPGDVIATGTPGGVGHAMNPPTYLTPGDVVEVEVPGMAILRSRVEMETVSRHD